MKNINNYSCNIKRTLRLLKHPNIEEVMGDASRESIEQFISIYGIGVLWRNGKQIFFEI